MTSPYSYYKPSMIFPRPTFFFTSCAFVVSIFYLFFAHPRPKKMSQSPDPSSVKGGAQGQLAPKSSTPTQQPPLTDSKLLRQFVMEYLQSHGFDKALEKLTEQVEDANLSTTASAAVLGDADVSKEVADGKATAGEQGGEKEAIFRAPGPVPLESNIKRNIPQAQAVSASTMSDRITPEFEAQAKYIIEQLQKKVEAVQEEGGDEKEKELRDGIPVDGAMVDVSDKVAGYEAYRRWVDGGLDVWKVGLKQSIPGLEQSELTMG